MIDTEPLYDLLRTNSVGRFLSRRSRNDYVGMVRLLLNELGFAKELQWDRLGPDQFYGEETVFAVRTFAERNTFSSDGLGISPQMLIRMIQRYDTIEGIQLIREGLENNTLSITFRPTDPNNLGTEQLKIMLQSLGFFEADVPEALRQFALKQSLFFEDGSRLSPNLARAVLAELLPAYGDAFLNTPSTTQPPIEQPSPQPQPQPEPPVVTPIAPLPSKELEIVDSSRSVSVSDGSIQIDFRKRDKGVYTRGFHGVGTFVFEHKAKLRDLELTESSIEVVKSVARNEGNLDAINTYDRGFVSLGIYQWTLGTGDKAGELAALLKKVKSFYPHTFRIFFQDFGIDIAEETNTTYGYLTYNGRRMSSEFLKNQFREPDWAFRFWRAAQNVDIQSVEIKHALARLNNFYWKDSFKVLGFGLNRVITSSFGVALLLDNHVNRPSWVGSCVEMAMLNTGLKSNPEVWTDAQEARLLEEYLRVRANYSENGYPPMTKAKERARGMQADMRSGFLSAQRGSFQVIDAALRSYDEIGASTTPEAVIPPPYYAQNDYPDIEIDYEDLDRK